MAVTAGGALVEGMAEANPGAVALAELVSLAAHIEPALLREARLRLLPGVDIAAEADLWWSSLVESRGPLGFVLRADVAEALRARLAARPERLRAARELTERMHQGASPAVALEEQVAWLAATGRAADARGELLRAVKSMVTEGDRSLELARWAMRAVPRLPAEARHSQAAWLLALGAGARIGGRRVLAGDPPPGTSERLADVLPEQVPTAALGLRLLDAGVELTYPPRGRSHRIVVPKSDSVVLEIAGEDDNGPPRQVALRFGERTVAPAAGVVTVTDGWGSSRRLVTPEVDIHVEVDRERDVVIRVAGQVEASFAAEGGFRDALEMAAQASSADEQYRVGEAMAEVLEAEVSFSALLRRVAFAGGTGRPPAILVTDAYPPLPWEFVPLRAPPLPEAPPFLGAQAAVAHWIAGRPPPVPRRLEIDDMAFTGDADLDEWDAAPVGGGSLDLRSFDLLHLGERKQPAGSYIAGYVVENEPDHERRAQDLMERGATGAVVRRWGAPDDRGAGPDLYRPMLDGWLGVGEVLRRLRAEREDGLGYQCFGHPGITLVRLWPAEIWDAASGARLLSFTTHESRVTAAAWAPDGARVVTGDAGGAAFVWDAATGAELLGLETRGGVTAVAVAPDGATLVVGTDAAEATVWALAGGDSLRELSPAGPVRTVSYSPGSNRVAYGDRHTTLAPLSLPGPSPNTIEPVLDLALGVYAPRGLRLAGVSPDGTVEVVDLETNDRRSAPVEAEVRALGWFPDGERVLLGSADGSVREWRPGGAAAPELVLNASAAVASASVAPPGDRIAVATDDGVVSVFDIASGGELLTIPAPGRRRRGVAFAPDGARLLTWSGPPPGDAPFPPPFEESPQAQSVLR